MVFKPGARLNPRQVLDRRGMGGAGGIALGGGGIGVILLLAYVLLGGDPGALQGVADPGFVTGPSGTELAQECQTGQDANERADCRIVGFVNSIQDYWTDAFAQSGSTYQAAETVLFDGGGEHGLRGGLVFGRAVLLSARHACLPRPRVLRRARVSVSVPEGGPLAEGYVVAHEYGHHIAEPDRQPARRPGRRRRRRQGRPHRAAGRLLRRRLGAQRREHWLPAPADPARTSHRRSTPPRRSVTTGSRSASRARSHPRRGPTGPRISVSSGS